MRAYTKLVGLPLAPGRLLPLCRQFIAVPYRMPHHHPHVRLHPAQNFLAPFLIAGSLPHRRHLHAQLVDPAQESRGLIHPNLQALFADQDHRLDQSSDPIAQQHPVHWVVDV